MHMRLLTDIIVFLGTMEELQQILIYGKIDSLIVKLKTVNKKKRKINLIDFLMNCKFNIT